MRASTDFPNIAPGETVTCSYDMSNELGTGETVSSVTFALTVPVYSTGVDASPSSHLHGSPSFSGAVVSQQLSGCLNGVTYVLTATVNTSAGQVLQRYSDITCAAIY